MAGASGSDFRKLDVRHLHVAGIRTVIYEAGSGPPVLLLHGSSIAVDSRLTWFRTVPALLPSFRVLAYDQPGFGESEMPAGNRYPDRLERARHAADLIDGLDLRGLTLVGHSEGGFIAAWLALHRPHRIARLVIVASGGTAPRLGGDLDGSWMEAARKAYDYIGRSVDEETFVRTEGLLAEVEDPPFEAVLRENFRSARRTGNLDMFLAKARGQPAYEGYTALQEREILPHAARLTRPCLLVWGGHDATVPVERGLALSRMLPASEFHLFPRAGHWVMHEDSAGFNRLLLGWLQDQS